MIGQLLGVLLGCSGPVFCPPPPLLGGQAPANAPALPIHDTDGSGATEPILRADGGAVPAERKGQVVTLGEPLVAGETYTLRHVCFERIHDEILTAAPARPLPTRTGTLTVTESGRKVVAAAGGPACFSEVDAAFAQLGVAPDPALVPFLSVVSWRLEIDGKTAWGSRGFGGVTADGSVAQSVTSRRLTLVHSACGASPNADPGIGPGFHVARLYAELAGGAPLEPAEATFRLDCGPVGGCGCGASSPGLFALVALAWVIRRRFR